MFSPQIPIPERPPESRPKVLVIIKKPIPTSIAPVTALTAA
jgi:hypothetical protein